MKNNEEFDVESSASVTLPAPLIPLAPPVAPDPPADPLDLLAAATTTVPSPAAHPVQDADDFSPTSSA